MPNYKLISTPAELSEICGQLINEPVLAVDTEFFWERTFYPILGVVQLATANDECYLIDAVTLPDIKALTPVLENKNSVKVLHDAPQDLGIIALASGAKPRGVFDTRASAGFAGYDSTASLQRLLKQILNIELSKSETRSNWIKRPLNQSQLRYAADDVLHLPALRQKLLQACADPTVRGWMAEENAQLDNPESFCERDPRQMYKRVKGRSHLNARQLAVLRELTAWRENKARRRDLPRNRVLSNTALLELSRQAPTSLSAAKNARDFPKKMPVRVITELLEAIERGMECPSAECPQPNESSAAGRGDLKANARELLKHIRRQCEVKQIDPALVASRADVEAYLLSANRENNPRLKLSQGWRRKIVGDWQPTTGN